MEVCDNFYEPFCNYIQGNGPFPSCLKPLFQSEAKCEAIDMKMISYSHVKKTSFSQGRFYTTWEFLELGNCLLKTLRQINIKRISSIHFILQGFVFLTCENTRWSSKLQMQCIPSEPLSSSYNSRNSSSSSNVHTAALLLAFLQEITFQCLTV